MIYAYLSKFHGLSREIWAGLAAVFTNSLGTTATLFLSLFFISQLHFNVSESGTLITAFGIGSIVGSYLSGRLCNHTSAYTISIFSLIINSITLFLVSFFKDFYLLMLVITLMGAANSAFVPANRVWLMRQCKEEDTTRINSLRFMIVNFGMGIAILIGGVLAKFGFTLLFSFNAGAVLFSAVILLLFGKRDEKRILSSEATSTGFLSKFAFFENRGFFFTYLTLLFVSLMFAQLRITYPIYLKNEYHLSTQLFSYLFLINTLIIVLFQVSIVDFVNRYNQFLTAAIGSFLIGLGMFLLIFGHSYFLAMVSCLIWTIGEILAFPIIQMLLYNRSKEKNKAIHMGLYQSVYSFANVAGPILGSTAYQFEKGIGVWILCGALGVACLIIGIALRNEV